MDYLNEVPEKDATGNIADIYADIRMRLGLPVVNLIYRHLAIKPDQFEKIWSEISKLLNDGDITASTTAYLNKMNTDWLEPLPKEFLVECGLNKNEQRNALNTLKVYEKANKTNAVIFMYLLSSIDSNENSGTSSSVSSKTIIGGDEDKTIEQILPIQNISKLSPGKIEMLESLSRIVTGMPKDDVIISSLLRHFANNNSLLAAFWVGLSSNESIEKQKVWEDDLRLTVKEDILRLSRAKLDLDLDTETREVIKLFGNKIIIRTLGPGRILKKLLSNQTG